MKGLLLGTWAVLSACASSKDPAVAESSDASQPAQGARGEAGIDSASHGSDANAVDPNLGDASESQAEQQLTSSDVGLVLTSETHDAAGNGDTRVQDTLVTTEWTTRLDASHLEPDVIGLVTFTFGGSVYTVRADGTAEPENVSARIERMGGSDRWLVPSPSGTVFALSSQRADDDSEILVRANADFPVITPVLAGGSPVYIEGMPAILDSGATIVFSASGGTHARDLFVTHEVDGSWSTPFELTTDSSSMFNNQPSLTRDQSAVLFNCGDNPDPETGHNQGCLVALDGGPVEVVARADTFPNNRNSYVNFPREVTGGIVFESAWPQGEDSPETIWKTVGGSTSPAVSRTFDNSVSPCVLPDDSLVLLWLGRPGQDGAHELTRVFRDGSYIVLWEGADVDDIGIGCTSVP